MHTQKTFDVSGMHCASCSTIIKRRISKLKGVDDIDVNFATSKASVAYDSEMVDVPQMNNEIQKLGYTIHNAHDPHAGHLMMSGTKEEKQKELEDLRSKVDFVLPVTITVFILMMWDIFSRLFQSIPAMPLPMELFNTISFLLSAVVLFWIGRPYLNGMVTFIRYGEANMDSLIGIGTTAAFVYSSSIFLFPPLRTLLNAPEYTYFDVTIVVIGFITLGKYLETRSKIKTGEAIEKLIGLQAKTATVLRHGKEEQIPVSEVIAGDEIIVKPGEKIPVDGIILTGKTSIDESMITGESIPNDKKPGDSVIGATINKQGRITLKATNVGSETMLAHIIKMVEAAQGSKADIQKLADRISAVFVPTVMIIAVVTLLVWLTVGTYFLGSSTATSLGLLSFVGILVIACPCALGLATPTAIIVGVGKGAQHGILIKNAESLEKLHSVNTIVFDKTGTITKGKPEVTDILLLTDLNNEKTVIRFAGSVEKHSSHPLAQALVQKANDSEVSLTDVTDFKETEGVGVEGIIDKKHISVRKPSKEEAARRDISQVISQGKTVIILTVHKTPAAAFAISDTVKDHAKQAIKNLHDNGIHTVMLTGDNASAAEFIAKQVGIEKVIAEVLPQDKASVIQKLQKEGNVVAMAGDGINDAPALTQANVGIAMSTGTDIAIESSDITLLHGDISKVSQAVRLSRATLRTIKQNLFWAFIYNVIGIPLAAGVFYPLFGIFLNPVFAGLAMGLSSVSVVSNSLLLKRTKLSSY